MDDRGLFDEGMRFIGRDDLGVEIYEDRDGTRFHRAPMFAPVQDTVVSDADLAAFVAEAAAGMATGPLPEPLSLPDPERAVRGVFRRGALPHVPHLVLPDAQQRAWTRDDMAVFLRASAADLAEVVAPGTERFSSGDVADLLVTGGLPDEVVDVDGAQLAWADRHVLVERHEAARALGVDERVVEQLGLRTAAALGAPMLVVLQWGRVVRVDVTATRRILDLADGWLGHLLGFEDASGRLELCIRLSAMASRRPG